MKTLIFDWGDTIMRDYGIAGAMWKWNKVDWIPNLEAALKELKGEYQLIVATSADHSGTEDMVKALKRINADIYFDHFYSQKELGFKKPDPRFFKSIIEHQKLNLNETVMIGNSYEKDIVGAKSAGLRTLFFNENKEDGAFKSADVIITDMTDLVTALKKVF